MAYWWGGAAVAVLVAVIAGIADWRRQQRADLDAVGWVDWRSLHVFALIAAAVCAGLVWRG
jgi:hypothetical protein